MEMYYKSIQKVLKEISLVDEKDAVLKSFKVLLEIMMAYGIAYKHYQDDMAAKKYQILVR